MNRFFQGTALLAVLVLATTACNRDEDDLPMPGTSVSLYRIGTQYLQDDTQ